MKLTGIDRPSFPRLRVGSILRESRSADPDRMETV
jgi:hypothetical protein